MGDRSKIEWTDATWNPIAGCSVVSPGCTNCYAMRLAPRTEELSTGAPWAGASGRLTRSSKAGPVWTGALRLVERRLGEPLRWRRPRRIFVNSMSDLFHESAPDAWIDRVFAVMALCPQHTFQILTKRPARMRAYVSSIGERLDQIMAARVPHPTGEWQLWDLIDPAPFAAPLPNVWLGVSVEDQARADERIPELLATPAAVRWISAEPLLGPIDLLPYLFIFTAEDDAQLDCPSCDEPLPFHDPKTTDPADIVTPRLDWVVAGGESGPNARPMHPDWVRSLRDQCAAADVPFLFKQWGDWLDERVATSQRMAPGPEMFDRFGRPKGDRWHPYDAADRNGGAMIRVGKKAAGRLLDGMLHDAYPEPRP
ncbi:MAG: phage Gp37/Gp68 family protein [Ancylobacter novellus]|uniref:Phage Gp37/Gp68 family protein n=1 Tax=Ancylobacter novellus TaxID=921 RepID=A0A2W5KW14_ANCNO|nr:MAG: phage Gp37/Gp68 family protein [Ancylobacter novellus]